MSITEPSDLVSQADDAPTQALQYRVRKLENLLGLERKLRRSREAQTQLLRQRLQRVLVLAREARVREQNLSQRLSDPDATVLSVEGAQFQAQAQAQSKSFAHSHSLQQAGQPSSSALSRSTNSTNSTNSIRSTNSTNSSAATAHTVLTSPPNLSRNSPNALPTHFQLYEYRIDSVLGQGGFGITYLATDVNLNVKVAIKEYFPTAFAYRDGSHTVQARHKDDVPLYQTGLDNFLVEARTLATFRHPNIVRVARFFEAHQSAYIVLEYERGQPLRSAYRKALAEQELLALLQPLLDGLSLVHEAGYLHRDIKPDNIYVRNEDGSLVLLDFGAAQHASSRANELSAVLTPGYAPLEQYEGKEQGPWTDVYAFAATLYWLVTGQKPPAAPDRQSGAATMSSALEAGKGRYSNEFLSAIDAGLALERSARPQSIAEFAQLLFAAHHASLGLQAALQREEGEAAPLFDWRENLALLRQSPQMLWRKLVRASSMSWLKTRLRKIVSPSSWPMAVKMTLALTISALLPMVITAYYNLNGSIDAVSSSESRNLERLAQSVAGRIGQLNGDSQHLADFIARDEQFVNYLRQPNEETKKLVYQKIGNLTKVNPDVHRVLLIDQQGIVQICDDPHVVGARAAFRDYFRSAMAGKSYATGIVISATDGSPGIFYSNPVFDGKRVIGVVVLRIRGSTVDHLLMESTEGTGRVPFLLDGDGVVIAHPDKAQRYRSLIPLSASKQAEIAADRRFGKQQVTSLAMPDLAKAMVGAKQRGNLSFFSSISQEVEHAGYAPVHGHNWVVGITESRSQFEAPLQRLFTHVLYSVVLVGLLFLLLAIWFARSIVKPILRLTDAANALKEGNFDKANIHVTSNDEIGKLARTFNVMIDVLRQRERERKRGRSKNLDEGL